MNRREKTGTGIIGGEEQPFIKLELKYCERCGGLWVRRRGEMEARCEKCVSAEIQMMKSWRARSHSLNATDAKAAAVGDALANRASAAQAAALGPAELSMGAIQP